MPQEIETPAVDARNCLNYNTDGGDKLVIGGSLEVKEGATVTGIPASAIPAATGSTIGGVKAASKSGSDTVEAKIGSDKKLYVPTYPNVPIADNQSASTAAAISDLVTDFNALLEKLKTAGLMEDDPETDV